MDDWSDDELEAAVSAYLEMLQDDKAGRPYNKADVNAELRQGELSERSKGSIEYRMQNISAVLEGLGREWIAGYKPARNVGAGVRQRLIALLKKHGV
jgi:5-methylcytosine-specific restriction protein A